ncbi:MAG: hypothetical protein ABIJ48_08345 [Actinomycetota bacterium]
MAVALLMALAALALASCGDGGVFQGSTTTHTEAPSTTAAPTTTGTTPATTPSSSTSTATTPTVATTLGPPPVSLEFLADGLNIVDFGATPNDAIDAVRSYLGFAPTFDSGWGPAWGDYGACPGTGYRQVAFQGLVLKFTDADIFQPAGIRHFFSWSYDGNPPGIAFGPLDLGITVTDLQALHPSVLIFGGDEVFGSTFRVEGAGGEQLWGTLSGTGAGDTATFLTGGWGCGE